MKRIACALTALALSCMCASAYAEVPDISGLNLETLYGLRDQVNARISELEHDSGQKSYDSGSYMVGRDIPAGDYVLTENDDAMFASVIIREEAAEDSGLVSHNLINRQCVIRLTEGTWVTLSEAKACPLEEAQPVEDSMTDEGGYLVGTMLPAGRYEIYPADMAPLSSYSIYNGILGTGAQLIKFEVLHDHVAVSLNDGEYIELSGCKLGPVITPELMEETEQ